MSTGKKDLTINRARNAVGDVTVPTGRVAVIPAGFRPRVEQAARSRKPDATTTALHHHGGQSGRGGHKSAKE
jgi:hypothetical protein